MWTDNSVCVVIRLMLVYTFDRAQLCSQREHHVFWQTQGITVLHHYQQRPLLLFCVQFSTRAASTISTRKRLHHELIKLLYCFIIQIFICKELLFSVSSVFSLQVLYSGHYSAMIWALLCVHWLCVSSSLHMPPVSDVCGTLFIWQRCHRAALVSSNGTPEDQVPSLSVWYILHKNWKALTRSSRL